MKLFTLPMHVLVMVLQPFQNYLQTIQMHTSQNSNFTYHIPKINHSGRWKMASKEVQETAEYYQWLIRIERQEFEEELLEIVSFNFLPQLFNQNYHHKFQKDI